MTGNWLWQSLFAMVLLVPAWLAIGFFDRNFHVRPDVFLVWYFLGSAVYGGVSSFELLIPSWGAVVAVFGIGVFISGPANSAIFQAVIAAPNPGLPVAIGNAASVFVFLAAIGLYQIDKIHFSKVHADMWSFVGVMLVVVGVALIGVRR